MKVARAPGQPRSNSQPWRKIHGRLEDSVDDTRGWPSRSASECTRRLKLEVSRRQIAGSCESANPGAANERTIVSLQGETDS